MQPTQPEYLNAILIGMFGLANGLIALLITWLVKKVDTKVDKTFDLYYELNSESMKKSRSSAYKLLSQQNGEDYSSMNNLPAQETVSLWHVLGFYQKLWIMIEYKKVSEKLILRLFGELFVWWYIFSFETDLIHLNWEASSDIKNLYRWIEQHSNSENLNKWKEKAMNDKVARQASKVDTISNN